MLSAPPDTAKSSAPNSARGRISSAASVVEIGTAAPERASPCRTPPGSAGSPALTAPGPWSTPVRCQEQPIRCRSLCARALTCAGAFGNLVASSPNDEHAASFCPSRSSDMASFSRLSGAFALLPKL